MGGDGWDWADVLGNLWIGRGVGCQAKGAHPPCIFPGTYAKPHPLPKQATKHAILTEGDVEDVETVRAFSRLQCASCPTHLSGKGGGLVRAIFNQVVLETCRG